MNLHEKLSETIKKEFGGPGELEDLIKSWNYVATHIPGELGDVMSVDIFRILTEAANNMMIDSYQEMKKKNEELEQKIKEFQQIKIAPKGDETKNGANIQLSNSN